MSVAGCARAAGVGSGERGMHLRRSRQVPPTSVARSFAKQSRKRVRANPEGAARGRAQTLFPNPLHALHGYDHPKIQNPAAFLPRALSANT